MKIFNRIFLAAILAGGIAGVFLAFIQHQTIMPILLEAETYESSEESAANDTSNHDHGHDHSSHHHDEDAWAPGDGAERTFFTALNSFIIAIGFALILTALYSLHESVNWKSGIIWGFAGFCAVNLAPSFGLPPQLPGDAAADFDIGQRQVWWVLTVLLTATGIWLIAFSKNSGTRLLGIIFIVLPHIFGAPQSEIHAGLAPAELREKFIHLSLLTNAVFWTLLGALSAYFYTRFKSKEQTNPA